MSSAFWVQMSKDISKTDFNLILAIRLVFLKNLINLLLKKPPLLFYKYLEWCCKIANLVVNKLLVD